MEQHDPSTSLFSNSTYRWWFAADTSSALAISILTFVIPLMVASITRSTGLASTVSSVFVMISTLIGVFGGVIQDSHDRKALMILYALCTGLICLAGALLVAIYGLSFYILIALVLLLALQKGLLGGASNAILKGIVPNESLPKAMAANNARDSSVNLIAGPVGGFLMSISSVFALGIGFFLSLISLVSAKGIKNYWKKSDDPDTQKNAPEVKQKAETKQKNIRTRVGEAFLAIPWVLENSFQRRVFVGVALISGAANAFLLFTVLEIMQSTNNNIASGIVNSSAAVGMLVGGLIATYLITHVKSGVLIMLMFVDMVLGLSLAAVLPYLWAKFIFVPCALIFLPAGSSVISSFLTILVSKDKLGRFASGTSLITYGVLVAIQLVGGWIMDIWGYQVVCYVLAALMIVCAYFVLSIKPMITMPKPTEWAQHIKKYNIKTL